MSDYPKGSTVVFNRGNQIDTRVGFMWNDDSSSAKRAEQLKVQCFYDLKPIEPAQYFNYEKNKYEVHLHCKACDRRAKVILSEEEITKINEQGIYQAFLGF